MLCCLLFAGSRQESQLGISGSKMRKGGGEIKAQWQSLKNGELCMGDWYTRAKLKKTLVFKVDKKLIMSVNAPSECGEEVILLKTYPTPDTLDMRAPVRDVPSQRMV